jgi:NhaP-type Na+/H+ or K+/H+ antiporter
MGDIKLIKSDIRNFTYCLLFGVLISPADPIVSLVPDRVG